MAGLVLARISLSGRPPATVWAEDGRVFLGDALSRGPEAVFSVYAGYAHLLPRVLTEALVLLPVSVFGYATIVTAALVCGAIGAFVYCTARQMTGSTLAAFVAALAPGLIPALQVESLGNLANLQWLLLYAAMWSMIAMGASARLRAVLYFVTAATTPLSVLLLPGACLARGRRALRDKALLGLVVGLAVQAVAIVTGPRSALNPASRNPGIPPEVIRRVFNEVFGPAGSGLIGTGVGVAVVALLVSLGISATVQLQRAAAAAAVSGLLILTVTTVLTGVLAARYAAFAGLALLGGAAALLLAQHGAKIRRTALIVLLVISTLVAFPASAVRLSGPGWGSELDNARGRCMEGAPEVVVAVAPDGWGGVTLACDALFRGM